MGCTANRLGLGAPADKPGQIPIAIAAQNRWVEGNQQGDRAMSRIAMIFLTIPLAVSAPSRIGQASTAREPAALAALDRMGSALAKKTEVNVHTDITAEDVLTTGQKLQYSGTIDVAARRPNSLRMSVKVGPTGR